MHTSPPTAITSIHRFSASQAAAFAKKLRIQDTILLIIPARVAAAFLARIAGAFLPTS